MSDPRCPHCTSTMVQPPNADGDYSCLPCGERWPAPKSTAALDDLRAEAWDEPLPPLRGRPSIMHRVAELFHTDHRAWTAPALADLFGVHRTTIMRATRELERMGLITVTTDDQGNPAWCRRARSTATTGAAS